MSTNAIISNNTQAKPWVSLNACVKSKANEIL